MGRDLQAVAMGAAPGAWLRRYPLTVASGGFLLLALPVLWRGALLADDFANCRRPIEDGLGPTLASSWERLGAIRPARFVEILLTTGVCERLPFGLAIAVPFALTIAVAWLLRGLLRDLQVAGPWPDVAGIIWLLQPLGTEAALWPAALHVPLGLALGLAALRLLHRDRLGWGAMAALGAFLSVEQTILALPLAAWLTAPPQQRRRSTLAVVVVVGLVAIAFLAFPGGDQRLAAGVIERFGSLVREPAFYVQFPAVGVGAHSIPLAIWWMFPWSLLLLAIGAATGWWLAPRQADREVSHHRRISMRETIAAGALLAAANAPVLLNVPRQGSPRIFTPTWLLLAAFLAVIGSRVSWRRPQPAGALAGLLAVGAVLSLGLSVSVRLASADVVEAGAHEVAARTVDGDVVALCEVPRTAVQPAPRGAFAVQDFLYDWAAADAIAFYADRDVTVRVAGSGCPDTDDADLVLDFSDIRTAAR